MLNERIGKAVPALFRNGIHAAELCPIPGKRVCGGLCNGHTAAV